MPSGLPCELPPIRNVKIGNETLPLAELLKRDYDDVREASQLLPGAMAWLGWQRAVFQEQLFKAEQEVKAIRSRLYLHYRQNGVEETGYTLPKPTEAAIEAAIQVTPEYAKAQSAVGQNSKIVSYLTSYLYALERKIEIVRSGEATHRKAVEHGSLSDEELEAKTQEHLRREKQE